METNRIYPLKMKALERISGKMKDRDIFNKDKTLVCANQEHSILAGVE